MRSRSTSPSRQTSALAVLVGARSVLEQGWLQNAERLIRTDDGRLRPRGRGVVVSACLVGAVVEAGRRYDHDPTASGPALDALWLALYEQSSADAVGRVPSPIVRNLRARDLARWNDAPERTVDDVLGLVDRATWRVWAQQRATADTQGTATPPFQNPAASDPAFSDPAGRPEAADAARARG
jgi:hypothetical protein